MPHDAAAVQVGKSPLQGLQSSRLLHLLRCSKTMHWCMGEERAGDPRLSGKNEKRQKTHKSHFRCCSDRSDARMCTTASSKKLCSPASSTWEHRKLPDHPRLRSARGSIDPSIDHLENTPDAFNALEVSAMSSIISSSSPPSLGISLSHLWIHVLDKMTKRTEHCRPISARLHCTTDLTQIQACRRTAFCWSLWSPRSHPTRLGPVALNHTAGQLRRHWGFGKASRLRLRPRFPKREHFPSLSGSTLGNPIPEPGRTPKILQQLQQLSCKCSRVKKKLHEATYPAFPGCFPDLIQSTLYRFPADHSNPTARSIKSGPRAALADSQCPPVPGPSTANEPTIRWGPCPQSHPAASWRVNTPCAYVAYTSMIFICMCDIFV